MSKFFDLESPFMRGLNLITDLLVLNLLTLLFCLPIVTAGASLTAMHYMLIRLTKGEEGYIVSGFWKAFRANFKQATKLWAIFGTVLLVLGTDVYIFTKPGDYSSKYKLAIYAITFTVSIGTLYVFPIAARYETTIRNIIKNAFAMAFYGFFRSIIMLVITVAPWVLSCFVPNFVLLAMLFGLTLPGYASACLYRKTFAQFEEKAAQAKEDAEKTESDDAE